LGSATEAQAVSHQERIPLEARVSGTTVWSGKTFSVAADSRPLYPRAARYHIVPALLRRTGTEHTLIAVGHACPIFFLDL
jgi:hypothetical protein